jgi:carboxyvinyl-carboxyphosphonate phosphorylmutase
VTAAARLRRRLAEPEILVVPGAADAITARIIEEAGFEAVYVTGAGFSNASLGLPDVGLTTLTEVVTHVQRVADAVDVPLIVDADAGYGGVLNVHRAVRQIEHAGAAAIQLEDQAAPKRCGHFDGNTVVSVAEMKQRIAAAFDARQDPDLLLIARTDAYQSEGFDGVVRRAEEYVAAGADAIVVEAPTELEHVRQLPQLIDAPLVANMVEGGKTPLLDAATLQRMGYRVVLFANTALRVAVKAVQEAMAVLRAQGSTASLLDRMVTWEERQRLIGLPHMQALEARFLGLGPEGVP